MFLFKNACFVMSSGSLFERVICTFLLYHICGQEMFTIQGSINYALVRNMFQYKMVIRHSLFAEKFMLNQVKLAHSEDLSLFANSITQLILDNVGTSILIDR